MAVKQKNIGSNFDDFLAEEGILNEVETTALKRVTAFQEMEKKNITKTDMATTNISQSPRQIIRPH